VNATENCKIPKQFKYRTVEHWPTTTIAGNHMKQPSAILFHSKRKSIARFNCNSCGSYLFFVRLNTSAQLASRQNCTQQTLGELSFIRKLQWFGVHLKPIRQSLPIWRVTMSRSHGPTGSMQCLPAFTQLAVLTCMWFDRDAPRWWLVTAPHSNGQRSLEFSVKYGWRPYNVCSNMKSGVSTSFSKLVAHIYYAP
jgi:hypothetical protein